MLPTPTDDITINRRKHHVDDVLKVLNQFTMGEQVEITRAAGELMKANPSLTMDMALAQAMEKQQ